MYIKSDAVTSLFSFDFFTFNLEGPCIPEGLLIII